MNPRLRRFLLRHDGLVSIWGCLSSEGHQMSLPWMRCGRCGRRRWVEEIVVNCGWCERCLDHSYAEYMKAEDNRIEEARLR